MPEGIERYGLTQNPFRVSRELDLLTHDEDRNLLTKIDGFSNLDEIDNYIKDTVERRQTLYFLIVGRSGTGRSTIANYIFSRYAHYRGFASSGFIVPNLNRRTLDRLTTFKRWFIKLELDLNRKKYNIPPELKEDLRQAVKAVEQTTMDLYFNDLARRISDFLLTGHEAPNGFSCFLDNVPDIEVIDSALQIFDQVETVCVFTVWENDTQIERVVRPLSVKFRNDGKRIIELSTLTGADVNLLIEARWRLFTKTQNPFDPQGVETAFRDRSRPVGRILSLIADLIDLKLAQNHSGSAWPEAVELAFSEYELCRMVTILENRIV